jgi:hypothetical protein
VLLQVATGGYPGTAGQDLKLALHLLMTYVPQLETLAHAGGKQQGLTYHPRQPGDSHPHVHIRPRCTGPGIYALAVFVALASLATGLKVGRDRATQARIGTALSEPMLS